MASRAKKQPVGQYYGITDSDFIAYCHDKFRDNPAVIELCDRLTHANIRLTAATTQVAQALETLKCESS